MNVGGGFDIEDLLGFVLVLVVVLLVLELVASIVGMVPAFGSSLIGLFIVVLILPWCATPVVRVSLNVPVPGRIKRLAADLEPDLYEFDRVRERHTLVAKRFGERTPAEYAALEQRGRRVLSGAPAFEARVSGIGVFERPVWGPGPVVYLAVESPGLIALHDRFCGEFPVVEDIEGERYTPHVTLARGGSSERARRLSERDIDPVAWTVSELAFWDGTHEEVISRVPLPA